MDPVPQVVLLKSGRLVLKVFQVSLAEAAVQRVEVEVHVLPPRRFQRT